MSSSNAAVAGSLSSGISPGPLSHRSSSLSDARRGEMKKKTRPPLRRRVIGAAVGSSADSGLFKLLVLLVAAVAVFDLYFYATYSGDSAMNVGLVLGGAGARGSPGIGRDHRPFDNRQFVRRREDGGGEGEAAVSDSSASVKIMELNGGVIRMGGRNKAEAAAMATDNGDNSQGRLIKLIQKAGIILTEEAMSDLPSWSEIAGMYGPEPIIVGLDTCGSFRTTIVPSEAYIGPAGMFNSGTNLLAELLEHNCALPEKQAKHGRRRTGMRWQVPWGKHTPASWRLHNVADADRDADDIIEQTDVLPVVTTKDPYGWMGSMCRHPYAAQWNREKEHCPNLVPNEVDRARGFRDNGVDGGIPVRVQFKANKVTDHTSLAGLWNDWYGAYMDVKDYPRLIVRFEDLLLHTEEVVTKVCECGGGRLIHNKFEYVSQSAKGNKGPHQGSSGLLDALVRYGDPVKRVEGMTEEDVAYAKKTLRKDLMDAFGYAHPSGEAQGT